MRKLRYNVAVSLDGYIARSDGSFDWIVEDSSIDFDALFAQFDTLLMGRKTYEVVRSQGAGGPFEQMDKVIVSRSHPPGVEGNCRFIGEDFPRYVQILKAGSGRDIWLFGGGTLFRALLDVGLVDTVEVAVMPVLLGDGIPMLARPAVTTPLELISCKRLASGIVMLKYGVRTHAA
ncbi:MAG: dihydrofolate reductase [Bacteroidetes bacterium]|nr:dihydrofolate reductase [Bacteroidota bacterium]